MTLEMAFFKQKMTLEMAFFKQKWLFFIDEKGDGAEADDAVVEGVWLPP